MTGIVGKFRLFGRLNISKRNCEILKDDAKCTLIVSQVVLRLVNFWPENNTFQTKIIFSACLAAYITMQISFFMYLITSIEDMGSFTQIMSSLSVGMQVIAKMSILFFNHKELNAIIRIIRYEFWPSTTMGKSVQKQIRSKLAFILISCISIYVFGVVFLFQIVAAPVMSGIRMLPHNSWYPFDWTRSPTYEILYLLQAFMIIYVTQNIVVGCDYLYASICFNCTIQFHLLCEVIKEIGNGRERELLSYFLRIPGLTRSTIDNTDDDERKLLILCIQHHQKLLSMCLQLNKLFNYGHLYQFVASVTGLCASCYLITNGNTPNERLLVAFYILAYVSQLFQYCAVSNEVTHSSLLLSTATFQCVWYKKNCSDFRKCLSIFMQRSQKEVSMKAAGLFVLNYTSFVAMMRFTFSLYTFLDNFTEK